MTGNLWGNIAGMGYLLAFQFFGLLFSVVLLKKESSSIKILTGSVFGSVLMQWTPILFAFFLGFSVLSHLLALGLVGGAALAVFIKSRNTLASLKITYTKNKLWLVFPIILYLLFCFLVFHSFRIENEAVYSSQCTFGDMSMHLGFITSIANQGIFPPDYSILPGVPLAYPFLSDSISSSVYIFGSSLRVAYILPMLVAGAQVFMGFMMFMKKWLKERSVVIVAFVLFFLNGGFGFFYFFPGAQENPGNFTRIFTEFYKTPTNLTESNIRWSNIVVDMLVPQRATLFGWAVLFAALLLLYKGVSEKKIICFALAGILAGALPMIHTHSFLVLALVSVAWLIFTLFCNTFQKSQGKTYALALVLFPFLMALLQLILGRQRETPWLLTVALALGICLVLSIILLLIKNRAQWREQLNTWGLYLAITVVFAVPQLLKWTFQQAQGESFTRGYFNWANLSDHYLWFYIMNIGVVALFFIPAVLWAKKHHLMVISPVLLIWFFAETVVFQPNTYDNNKLLYIAYFFICGLVADFAVTLYRTLRQMKGTKVMAASLAFLATISAALTLGRESVASYELFSADQVAAAQYVSDNAEPSEVFLTNPRHNNSIATLSGRNIVCGAGTYLHFHGLDYVGRYDDIKSMYEMPTESQGIFKKYNVTYLMISSYERNDYQIDEDEIRNLFPLVFESGEVQIYKVENSNK